MNDNDSGTPPVQSPEYGRGPNPFVVMSLIVAFCALQFGVRLLLSPVVTADAPEQLLMSQSFQFGYGVGEAPLTSWLLSLFDLAPGLSPILFFGVKYALLAFGVIMAYRASLHLFGRIDEDGVERTRYDLAALATLAWGATYYGGWAWHQQDAIQPIVLFTALSLSLHALTHALGRGNILSFAYFGFAAGLGALADYRHVIFTISALLAANSIRALRAVSRNEDGSIAQNPTLRMRYILLVAVIALVIFAPHAWWMWLNRAAHITALGDWFQTTLASLTNTGDLLATRRHSLTSLVAAWLEFSAPLSVLFILLFWPMWFPFVYPFFPRREVYEGQIERVWRRLLSRSLWIGALLFLLYALATGSLFDSGTMVVVLFVLPAWLMLQVQRSGPYFISQPAFVIFSLILMATSTGLNISSWFTGAAKCDDSRCLAYTPIPDWIEGLQAEGFSYGTIVSDDVFLTGNLRLSIPNARLIDAQYKLDAYPLAGAGGACLAVWRETPEMPVTLAAYFQDELGVRVVSRAPEGAINRRYIKADRRSGVLYYRYMPPNRDCN